MKSWLTRKDPDAAKDWRQEKKRTTKDEMVGCHHWLIGHEFEQAPGVGDRQGSLECCSLWGLKESDTTEWLNNSNKYEVFRVIKITETRGKVVISGLWQDGKNGNYCLMGVGFWWKFEEEIYKVKIVCRWMMAMVTQQCSPQTEEIQSMMGELDISCHRADCHLASALYNSTAELGVDTGHTQEVS